MKVEITRDGILRITAETETESYALETWENGAKMYDYECNQESYNPDRIQLIKSD